MEKTEKKQDAKAETKAPKQVQAPAPVKGPAGLDYRYLVRIANTDLDGRKSILYAMRKIKGINVMYAHGLLSVVGINEKKKSSDLSPNEIEALEDAIKNPNKFGLPAWLCNRRKDPVSGQDKHLLTSDLIFTQDMDIKIMKKTKSYKGLRHQWGLPVRGQRTKSNFRKNKGKSLGVQRKKSAPSDDKKK